MIVLTDYPIEKLGDSPDKTAPIRMVRLEGWDGDKYAAISISGCGLIEIKRFYLYRLTSGKPLSVKFLTKAAKQNLIVGNEEKYMEMWRLYRLENGETEEDQDV